ncbi:MAG: MMPL family transporter [Candidatus Binatus sp.]|uniref:MMPL family transporter n=1 Tax=Candidatus Binatus sp. TaxID=2811406 RepID=UPI00271EB11B|nr:MMPL family transporter [Candidatus Binatus sp.]MDO8431616.1 MMPL family transporter [Candidatus Binatus sp.]
MTAPNSSLNLRYRMFRALARLNVERPWLVLLTCFALAAASILYTKERLEFHVGQDDLVSGGSADTRNYHNYTSEFPDLDGLIVVVQAAPSPARAELFADTLAARLLADRANVRSVFYQFDRGMLSGGELLYMSVPELNELAARIRDNRALLTGYAASPDLASLFKLINDEANRAMMSEMLGGLLGSKADASKPAVDSRQLDLGFVEAILSGMVASDGKRMQLPWDRLTSSIGDQNSVLRDGYLASDNGKYLLMQVAPGDGVEHGPDAVDVIQRDLDEVRAQFPDVEAGMTGGPALARSEESSTAHDIALASVIAIVSNVLLLVIPFGGIVEPAFALIALLVGVAWSFGFTTLAVGHLNLLSAVFTSVLAGIGINFPIHVMARYDEARRAGRTMADAVELGVVNTGVGVVASASIMALSFLMPIFSDFRGIAELGLISAAGIFFCLLSAMFVFPALVVLRDRNRIVKTPPALKLVRRDSILKRVFSRPAYIVGGAVAITLAMAIFAIRVRFDQNLLKLQAEGSEAVKFEGKLLKDSGRSSWFAVALAPSRVEAERKAASFRKLPEVSDAETIASYIPDQQPEKSAILYSLRPDLEPIKVNALSHPGDPAMLTHELESLRFKLGSAKGSDPSGSIERTVDLLDDSIARLHANPNAFADYEKAMATGLAAKLSEFKRSLSPKEVTQANLAPVLRDRFIGKTGRYLVQIYPKGDIWDDAPLHRFVTALRGVEPDVTGPPVQTYAIATVMRRGYERAAVLALLAVFIFVFADFRNLRDTALATVPLIFGGAWLLETMGLLGWEFNLANLFAVPIIIGTGVDNGVNMVYRWREERDKSDLILDKSVGKSVTLASLTTIAGFAALIPATHRGISSLGWVLSIGVVFILIATLLVLPAIFELFGKRLDRTDLDPGEIEPIPPRRVASRRSSGMLAIIVALAAVAAVASSSYAASQNRVASDAIVNEAERIIKQAGAARPTDTKLVHQAIDKLHQAIRVDPRNDSAYVDLGFCYGLLHDGPTAVDMYLQATKINPSAPNFLELADVYLRMGQSADALMAANAGLIKEPENARLYNAKGLALNDSHRFDEAEEAFEKALKYDANLAIARTNLTALNGGQTGRGSVSKHSEKPPAPQPRSE